MHREVFFYVYNNNYVAKTVIAFLVSVFIDPVIYEKTLNH
jgi:hypothetical protein